MSRLIPGPCSDPTHMHDARPSLSYMYLYEAVPKREGRVRIVLAYPPHTAPGEGWLGHFHIPSCPWGFSDWSDHDALPSFWAQEAP